MHPAVAAAKAFKAVHDTGQVPDYERILRQGYSRFLAPGDVVVDVGAHTGLHLVAFADIVGPTGKVHAFEPIPFLMKDLARRFGRRPEVELHDVALSDTAGRTDFTVASVPGESGLLARYFSSPAITSKTIKVRTERLDTALGHVPAVAYIKMDIEGGELNALSGATQLLRRCRPIVSVEYGWAGYSAYGHAQDSLYRFAESHGYVCADITGNLIDDASTWLAVSDYVTWDFFLVPLERRPDWGAMSARRPVPGPA
ncbi:FkbM family methyltransferase [Methylobacterium sp. NMS14P]|uniref:FkbM family methyltransferase n=1 Tax=Methylobacterium sp. NMS14P TaxID=2894310 RepID=UPI002358B05E|nr:FkbM family methyltransferase [Methylobacterium sp. NMS14P]WCS27375.1 FkbM family methyltransferase [Methylobacterium sp. NMS14P]